MEINELSVFMENRPGQLLEITSLLAKAGINMLAINISDSINYGHLRMIVDDFERAVKVFKENDLIFKSKKVYVTKVPNIPGALDAQLRVFGDLGIDIAYMYSLFISTSTAAYMVFALKNSDDINKIQTALTLVSAQELGIK